VAARLGTRQDTLRRLTAMHIASHAWEVSRVGSLPMSRSNLVPHSNYSVHSIHIAEGGYRCKMWYVCLLKWRRISRTIDREGLIHRLIRLIDWLFKQIDFDWLDWLCSKRVGWGIVKVVLAIRCCCWVWDWLRRVIDWTDLLIVTVVTVS
jgi:hypothetical protein